ncbi:MAG TPA: CHAT domain-containing tetratricopeptide repeat protein, partial [Chitinophagaceae bacterium]|nr:CHAT domain-containing tetratricopeptide repeat protein [Chitinophagaceae bacterium]
KALGHFNTAFQYERQYGSTANCITILNNNGLVYLNQMKDTNTAFRYFIRSVEYGALKGLRNAEDSLEMLNALTNLANAYSGLGKFDSAFKYYASAFNHIQVGGDENTLSRSDDAWLKQQNKVDYILNLMISKGDAWRAMYKQTKKPGNISEALRIYKVADQFLSRIRKEHSDIHSKLFWRNFSRRLYENAIEACHAQNDAATAFYFFEKSRAVLLNDQLNEQRWLGENDILKMTQVKKKVVNLERECDTLDKSSARFASAQNELLSFKQQLQLLIESVKSTNPLYYQTYLDTTSGQINLQIARDQILKDHQAIFEIFEGEESIYFLSITREKATLSKSDKKLYDSLVTDYLHMLSNGEMMNMQFGKFMSTANKLYNLVFSNSKIPAGRIIISPDGKYFPFESLVTNVVGGQPQYLIDNNSVSYTYSAGFLLNQFSFSHDRGTKNFLGVAPVKFASSQSLSMLTGSDVSLGRLTNRFPKSDNLINAAASKKNFLEKYHNYKIIQLYTHADQNLSGTEPVIHFVDSSLLLSDLIYEHRPATSLIVLSACETGAGKNYEGEGVFSFNRGFAALGIPSSISNLWQVDNESTYQITELFYKFLADGDPMDVALQKAKLAYRKDASGEKQLPYYWAAAVLSGKSDSIAIEKEMKWKPMLFIVIAGICVFLLISSKRNR